MGRGLLPVPLCALLRHAGVGSREQVQPPLPLSLAHANCTPFFSPKHLDFVTKKNIFFAILKILFFKPSQKMHFSSVLPIFCCF